MFYLKLLQSENDEYQAITVAGILISKHLTWIVHITVSSLVDVVSSKVLTDGR